MNTLKALVWYVLWGMPIEGYPRDGKIFKARRRWIDQLQRHQRHKLEFSKIDEEHYGENEKEKKDNPYAVKVTYLGTFIPKPKQENEGASKDASRDQP